MKILCLGISPVVKSICKVLDAFGYDVERKDKISNTDIKKGNKTILLFTDENSDYSYNDISLEEIKEWRNPVVYLKMDEEVGGVFKRNPLSILSKGSDIPSLVIDLPDDVPDLVQILMNWILQVEEVWCDGK